MSARYLLRFDDICPTMNWSVWKQIESTLTENGIKPILAVVPDNRDPELMVDPPQASFWDRVREWQSRGWTLAMHGYQHRYTTKEAGIIGLNRYSEFAGLARPQQQPMLMNAKQIFEREKIQPKLWIAPAHSFDEVTVEILSELGITTISDGFAAFPYTDKNGMFWVPQQFWKFRPMPFGVWTICMHHNDWKAEKLERFRRDVLRYKQSIIDYEETLTTYKTRRKSVLDSVIGVSLYSQLAAYKRLKFGNRTEKALNAAVSAE